MIDITVGWFVGIEEKSNFLYVCQYSDNAKKTNFEKLSLKRTIQSNINIKFKATISNIENITYGHKLHHPL